MYSKFILALTSFLVGSSFTSNSSQGSLFYIKKDKIVEAYSGFRSEEKFLQKKQAKISQELKEKSEKLSFQMEELKKKDKLSDKDKKEIENLEKEFFNFYNSKMKEMGKDIEGFKNLTNFEIGAAIKKIIDGGSIVINGADVVYGGQDISKNVLEALEKKGEVKKVLKSNGDAKNFAIYSFDYKKFRDVYSGYARVKQYVDNKSEEAQKDLTLLKNASPEEAKAIEKRLEALQEEIDNSVSVMEQKIKDDLSQAFAKIAQNKKIDLIIDSTMVYGNVTPIDEEVLVSLESLDLDKEEKEFTPLPSSFGYVNKAEAVLSSKKYLELQETINEKNKSLEEELKRLDNEIVRIEDGSKDEEELKRLKGEVAKIYKKFEKEAMELAKQCKADIENDLKAAARSVSSKENIRLVFSTSLFNSGLYYAGADLTPKVAKHLSEN